MDAAPFEPGVEPHDILIVDDMSVIRLRLSHHIQAMGHRATLAANGREALDILRSGKFDAVLLDVQMPEMDGYEVLAQIKGDELLRDIPVVMISGVDELDSVVRCIENGAEDYLAKPFNLTLLKARVRACLEKKCLWDELRQNYRQLKALEQLRDSLTGMIIHDLRTPLTSFLGGLQTLKLLGDMNADQLELLNISVKGGEMLLGMINDLLDVSKVEGDSMQLERHEVEPSHLMSSAVDQVKALADAKKLNLEIQVAPDLLPLQLDEEKMRRALVNLLGNAIKFTPTDGTIALSARGVSEGTEDTRSVAFIVSDTGEGIPESAFEKIFEKFGQVEEREAGRQMSTGLGLTFCRMVAEAHGGTIKVESTLGEGSTFTITLPT